MLSQIGKAKVVAKSDSDSVLVIAAGITLDQAFKAEKKLKEEHGVNIRLISNTQTAILIFKKPQKQCFFTFFSKYPYSNKDISRNPLLDMEIKIKGL